MAKPGTLSALVQVKQFLENALGELFHELKYTRFQSGVIWFFPLIFSEE